MNDLVWIDDEQLSDVTGGEDTVATVSPGVVAGAAAAIGAAAYLWYKKPVATVTTVATEPGSTAPTSPVYEGGTDATNPLYVPK